MTDTYPPTVTLLCLASALGVKYRPEYTAKYYLDQVREWREIAGRRRLENAWLRETLEIIAHDNAHDPRRAAMIAEKALYIKSE